MVEATTGLVSIAGIERGSSDESFELKNYEI
jgi:hypothetical protein